MIRQEIDDAVVGIWIELTGIGVFPAADITGKFDDGDLHAQADAQVWLAVFTAVSRRQQHAFAAAFAESAGHQDAVAAAQPVADISLSELF